jgi:hypothetical protein
LSTQRRGLKWLVALVIALAVAACDRGDRGRDETTEMAPPATMPGPVAVIRVTDVDVGKHIGPDKRLLDDDDVDEFAVMDTIYTVVTTEGPGENAALVTRWIFEDEQVVEESTQTISPTGPAVHEFHVSKPDGWPAGKYKVEVLLNGQKVDTEDFEVKK